MRNTGFPRLAIVTTIARADFSEPLGHFRRLEVWHLYHTFAKDVGAKRLDGHYVRFRTAVGLLLALLKIRPDIIQGPEPYDFPWTFTPSCAVLIAAGLLRVPFYFPMFEILAPEVKYRRPRGIPLGWALTPVLRWFLAFYAGRSVLIFAGNRGAALNLADVGVPERKITRRMYATWGVDLSLFNPTRDGSEPDWGENAVLFVGRIVEAKGVNLLLDAFVTVARSAADARLVFIGAGDLAARIVPFAKSHGLEGRISVVGHVPNRALPPYFRAAKVVATPSITTASSAEQVGMVNIQSMACGTPVVTSDAGAIPEFVIHTQSGLVVPERDVRALADALISVLTDSQLHSRLSAGGRRLAEERYDAARNIDEAERLILRATGVRSPERPT